jgi:hypothetical protein
LPWHILTFAALGFILYAFHQAHCLGLVFAILGTIVGVLLLLSVCIYYLTEDDALGKEWFKAKTEGVCPLIKIDQSK